MQEYCTLHFLASLKLCSTEYLGFHGQTRRGNSTYDSLLMKIPNACEHMQCFLDGWMDGWMDRWIDG